jgi:hypothetical protein
MLGELDSLLLVMGLELSRRCTPSPGKMHRQQRLGSPGTLEKLMQQLEPSPLIKFRYLDFILFGLIAILAVLALITYAEVTDLRRSVQTIEMEDR